LAWRNERATLKARSVIAGLILAAIGAVWMGFGHLLIPRWAIPNLYEKSGGLPIWTFGMYVVLMGAGIELAALFPRMGVWFGERPLALLGVAIAAVVGWLIVCAQMRFLSD